MNSNRVLPAIVSAALLLSLSGCGKPGSFEGRELAPDLLQARPLNATTVAERLRHTFITLCDRFPTPAEARSVLDGGDEAALASYREKVEEILAPECLAEPMLRYHQDLLEIGDRDVANARNRAANLGTYLVLNDLDYAQILTATFCVNRTAGGAFEQVTQNCASGGPVAGILTDPQVLTKTNGPFQFKRMNYFSTKLMGQPYPDPGDPGLQASQLPRAIAEDSVGGSQPVNFRLTTPLNCVACHATLNNRVGVFWTYDENGDFQASPSAKDPLGNTLDDFQALKLNGSQFHYYGSTIADLPALGAAMVSNPKFKKAAAKHLVNYVLGREFNESLPASVVEHYADVIASSGGKIRTMLREFLTSEYYLTQAL